MKHYSIVHVFAPNVLAGAERVVITGVNALSDLNYDITIILIRELRTPEHVINFVKLLNPKIKIIVLDSKSAFDSSLLKNITNNLDKISNPIIHTHGYKALILTYFATKNKYPIIHTHHGNTSHTLKVKIYEWAAMKIMNRINKIVCVSPLMQDHLKQFISNEKLITINNMLSLKNATEIRNTRKNFSKNKIINLLYIGRLSPEKGILYFVKSINQMPDLTKFKLTIVGDGPDKVEIENLIKEQHLEQNIQMEGFQTNPSKYYESADVLIMPSFTEGLPMTLIESLSVGLPVVANNVGAIPLLLNQVNGILINENSISDWNNGLNKMQNNLKLFQKETLNQSEEFENKYSAKNWAIETIKLYNSI